MKLTPTMQAILQCISKFNIPVSPWQVHHFSGIPHPTVKQYIRKLRELKLVEEQNKPFYSITEAGTEFLASQPFTGIYVLKKQAFDEP